MRILKSDAKQRYTLGVVYAPNEVDTQGDYAEAPEIEQACWGFMRGLQGRGQVAKLGLELLAAIAKAVRSGAEVQLDVTAAWETLAKGEGLGVMHQAWGDEIGEIVECYCVPADFDLDGQPVTKGTWLLGVVWSEEYFAKVEAGEITGLSMGGTGRRVPVG
jgi:hypothetical protein